MMRWLGHGAAIVLLTLLTQIGGLAWLLALGFRARLVVFVSLYVLLWSITLGIAPSFGRVPLNCSADGPLQIQSRLYCLANRHYVTPELRDMLSHTAEQLHTLHPGTQTLVLDANFPFFTGFPLLPHLSHDDGEKVDLAFFYARDGRYLPGFTRSPVGYFAFEPGPTNCPRRWLTLRWDMGWLQPLWVDAALEPERMRALLQLLTEDARVGKVFIEPHLSQRLGTSHPKIRFQGCRAARHDDHIHVQL